jgi:hypothetical protein
MGNLVRQLKSPALYSGFPINAPSAGAPALRLVVLYRIPISSVRLKVKMNE